METNSQICKVCMYLGMYGRQEQKPRKNTIHTQGGVFGRHQLLV